jgi:hypothetical protein
MQAMHANGAGIAFNTEILMTDMVPVFGNLALPASAATKKCAPLPGSRRIPL